MHHSIRRDPPGSNHLTPLDPGIPHTPTTPFDPVVQRDAARANANLARRCHYLKPSGERCGSPAMRGFELCYYHDRYQPKSGYRNLPCLEDPHSVQCAIQEIIEDMLSGLLDYKKAALALYGLQTAVANLKQMRIAEKERRESEEKQMNTGRTQGTRRELDSSPEAEDAVEEIELAAGEEPGLKPASDVGVFTGLKAGASTEKPATNDHRPTTVFDEPDEIELVAGEEPGLKPASDVGVFTGLKAGASTEKPTTNDHRPTTLIESPRPPQHVTRGLRTQAERRAMAQRFPDMKKARAEFLALLTPEERAQVQESSTSVLPSPTQ